MYDKVQLKKGKETIVLRGHPWIFSGAFAQSYSNDIEEGKVIEVYSSEDQFICMAHFQDASIAGRVLSYKKESIHLDFYVNKLQRALELRKALIHSDETNAFRWIHGEGDGLPGLVIDVYDRHVILELHSKGMYQDKEVIAEAVQSLMPSTETIYASLPSILRQNSVWESHYLLGQTSESVILENGNQFLVNWESGQKTGFFLDQRENRALLGSLSKNKSVLNLFSYSGGFSIYALSQGAQSVESVDISEHAVSLCKRNEELNGYSGAAHTIRRLDIMKDSISDQLFDIVIVDPPAFAKNIKKRHKAVQAYKRLNQKALKLVKPSGLLMTYSCSQVVSDQLFLDTIRSAFIAERQQGQILKHLEQGMDHPVSLTHEEGHYLKGLLIRKI